LKKCSTNLVASATGTSAENQSGGSVNTAPTGSNEAVELKSVEISDSRKELETLTMLQHKIMSDILDGIS